MGDAHKASFTLEKAFVMAKYLIICSAAERWTSSRKQRWCNSGALFCESEHFL